METKEEKKPIEIQYPHERNSVYLEGKSRRDDLMNLMCMGQGIYAGLDDVCSIIGDDSEYWKAIMLNAVRRMSDLKNQTNHPFVSASYCLIPGTYLCVMKNGKFKVVCAVKNNETGKVEWESPDVIIFFPNNVDYSCIDLLDENGLLE